MRCARQAASAVRERGRELAACAELTLSPVGDAHAVKLLPSRTDTRRKADILRAANVYYRLGAKLDLHWFLEQINHQPVGNHWQAMARASFREDLDWQQRSLTSVVLEGCKEQGECATILADWISEHEQLLSRWTHMLADFKTTSTHEFAKFSVALRELNLLQLNCRTSA